MNEDRWFEAYDALMDTAKAIRERTAELKLSVEAIARGTGLPISDVRDFYASSANTRWEVIVTVAKVLGLEASVLLRRKTETTTREEQ